MKFSILNTLKMGISIFTLASAAYVQAVQLDINDSVRIGGQDFQASIGLIPRGTEKKLKKEGFVTRPVIQSINEWQFNAIYLKAGIETLSKATPGDELTVIAANLSVNAGNINEFVQGSSSKCPTESGFETLEFLINEQNFLLLAYTTAYIDQDLDLVASLNQELIETNNDIYLFLLTKFSNKNEQLPTPDPLQVSLAKYLDALIILSQNYAAAYNFGTGDFIPAYDAYRESLDFAEQVGRLIGKAVVSN